MQGRFHFRTSPLDERPSPIPCQSKRQNRRKQLSLYFRQPLRVSRQRRRSYEKRISVRHPGPNLWYLG